MSSAVASAAYMGTKNMNPGQTAPLGAFLIWVHIVKNINYLRTYGDVRAGGKMINFVKILELFSVFGQVKQYFCTQ